MKVLAAFDSKLSVETIINQIKARPWPPGVVVGLLHVVDTKSLVSLAAGLESLVRDELSAANELVEWAASLLAKNDVEVVSIVREGYPPTTIVEFAKEWGADLVMVGSLGKSRIEKFFLGSVSKSIVRESPCSVEIVRPPVPGHNGGGLKILFSTDGSECSQEAAYSLANRPWPIGSEIRVISVSEQVVSLTDPWYGPSEMVEKIQHEGTSKAQQAIEAATRILEPTGYMISSAVLAGNIKEMIVEEAKEWGANLIVVGTHGWRGIKRILLGSVSDAVAIYAPCSVEIIRRRQLAA